MQNRPGYPAGAVCPAVLALAALALAPACKKEEPPPPPQPQQAALEQPSPPAAAPAAEAEARPKHDPRQFPNNPYPRQGFRAVEVVDQVPICLFPSFPIQNEARFLKDVKGGLKLEAGAEVVVGAFGPWCANEACDGRPSLQCQIKREGNILRIHTRYWGERKNGAGPCTEGCRPIAAGCASPKLEAGTYTLVHGSLEAELRIPSVPDPPCFGEELPQPPP